MPGEGKGAGMRIAVLGLGVIGTTYAYALRKAGHGTFHIVREGRNVPSSVRVHHGNEIFPYKIPAWLAGIAMKRLFAGNELTSRIMTLHDDVKDIVYGCRCVYDEGKRRGLELPLFYGNMDRLLAAMKD